MMFAHSGIEVLESVWLLVLWLIAYFYALAVGVGAIYKIFGARSRRWQPMHLGIFPLLFGGASLVWFRMDYRYSDVWWLSALAAVPLFIGLLAMLVAIFSKGTK